MLETAFDKASSQNTPSNGLQKHQNVLPVIEIAKSKEVATLDVQEMRKNGAQVRDVEDEWGGPAPLLGVPRHAQQQQKQSTVSGSGNVGNVGQTSHEKPAARPDRGMGPCGQASAFIHKALSGMHILLVEDTAVLQRLVSMTLKKLGANVTVVGDGLQAVTAVADTVETTTRDVAAPSHFDLILMDCAVRPPSYHCPSPVFNTGSLGQQNSPHLLFAKLLSKSGVHNRFFRRENDQNTLKSS